ncbi:MAG TPA: 4-hydroxy-tetrahydrodipicolinate synthase [Candidatus Limiplasma sp.]|nr:4-hydroxy-tetrahydrodipicolinate synthase [Candidatus Limiplasma sp.]
MPSLFQGSAVALVTPFVNGKVDTAAIERLVEMQLAGGTSAIVACGTTGEPTTMNADERELTVRTVMKAVKGRVPVIAGTGSNCTQNVIDTANRYEDLGCAAQLVVTPYYNKTTQEGLYRHYMAIAEATKLPIVIYNVPSRTALDISPEVLDRLASCEQFVALKESSYNLPYVMDKIRHVGGRLAVYSGNDDMVVPMMALGAEGVISVVANLLPDMVSKMARSYLAGDHATSLDLQLTLMPVICALFAEVSPIPCKAGMEMMGLCGGDLRLPLVPIGEANRAKLREALISVGVSL